MFDSQGMYWGKGDRRPVPMRIPGLVGWWSDGYSRLAENSDGSTPAIIATQPVGFKADLSRNGYHATQPVDVRRQTLTEVSNRLVAVGDGVDDNLILPLDAIFTTAPFTLIRKFRFDVLASVKGAPMNITQYRDSSKNPYGIFMNNANDKLQINSNDTAGNVKIQASLAALSKDVDYILMWTIDASFNMELFLDNVPQAPTSHLNDIHTGDISHVLGAFDTVGGQTFEGSIPESLFYSKVFNSYERSMMTAFLS